jgi:hypothetical protein
MKQLVYFVSVTVVLVALASPSALALQQRIEIRIGADGVPVIGGQQAASSTPRFKEGGTKVEAIDKKGKVIWTCKLNFKIAGLWQGPSFWTAFSKDGGSHSIINKANGRAVRRRTTRGTGIGILQKKTEVMLETYLKSLEVKEVTSETTEKIAAAVALLGNDDFDIREQGSKALVKIGRPVLQPLKKVMAESKDLEVVQRCKTVTQRVEETTLYEQIKKLSLHSKVAIHFKSIALTSQLVELGKEKKAALGKDPIDKDVVSELEKKESDLGVILKQLLKMQNSIKLYNGIYGINQRVLRL